MQIINAFCEIDLSGPQTHPPDPSPPFFAAAPPPVIQGCPAAPKCTVSSRAIRSTGYWNDLFSVQRHSTPPLLSPPPLSLPNTHKPRLCASPAAPRCTVSLRVRCMHSPRTRGGATHPSPQITGRSFSSAQQTSQVRVC